LRLIRTGFLLAIVLAVVPVIAGAQEKPFLTTAPTPEGYAWWLRTEYHPFGRDVRGIPVGKIRATWCKANEFRADLFPPDDAAYFKNSPLAFAVDGVFDGSKVKQTALTGVYETCKGERGAFLLVLALPAGRPPVVKFVEEIPGERQFAMVSTDGAVIAVFHCMECDDVSKFKWDRTKRRFVLLPPVPDE
jgi:hypothetical protein